MKSLLFHLLLCLSLLLSIKADATNSSILFKGKLPSTTTVPSFTITPGVTKQVTIDLTGSTDRLSILFIEDTYQIDMYKLVIRNNNMPETSQSADFLVAENLTLSLDTKKSLFVIQGDKKFRMSKIVREKSYDVEVEVEIVQPDVIDLAALQNQAKSTDNDKTFFYYIIAGVLGGIIGVIILVRLIRYTINRRKNIRVPRRSTQKKPSTAREVHPETHSPVFMLEEQCPELFLAQKGSINLDEKVMSEGEIEALNHLTPPNKKISLNSLTSLGGSALAQTNVTSASTLSSGFMSSSGSLNPSANSLTSVARDLESARGRRNDGSKKTTYLEAITEEPSVLKSTHPVDSGRFAREGQRDVPRILIKETTVSAHKVKLPKLNFEGKVKSMNIDGGQERFQENIMPKDPKNPTLGDIRRLAHKFMTQKQEREDSPDASESENEEQDFKAEPANFFCCMVCKVEKRTTIAEPCGHIFACGNCVRKIIEDKKGCKLCSRRVRHYQSMKNKTRSSSQKEKV